MCPLTNSGYPTVTRHDVSDIDRACVERVDIRQYKDEVIQLYEQNGKRDFARRFDWYYRDQGQEKPISWILRGVDGEICGLSAVTLRELRYGTKTVRAGVAGNLLVNRKRGAYLGALSLVRAMKAMVTTREIDILLGIPNALAEPTFLRLDFKIIDRFTSHVCIHRSRSLLQGHFGIPGKLASPLIDFAASVRRRLAVSRGVASRKLNTAILGESELNRLPVDQWVPPEGYFVLSASTEYLRWRFLKDPVNQYQVVALLNASEAICGYLVLRRNADRLWIVDCCVDHDFISESTAISAFCRTSNKDANSVWIAHLRSASLASQLASAGMVHATPSLGGYPDVPLVGFWLAEHPLANAFSQPKSWHLFTGFNDV